jgi:hypothetical protein
MSMCVAQSEEFFRTGIHKVNLSRLADRIFANTRSIAEC